MTRDSAPSVPAVRRGRLLILGAAVCWSGGGAAVKLAAPLNGWQIASIRSFFAFLFLTALLRPWRARPFLPGAKVLLLAFINAAMLILFILANTQTTSANAIFLQDTAPVWITLLSPWLLNEKFRMKDLRGLLFAAVGMSLFFVDQLTPGQWTGNFIALGSGVLYALVLIGMRWGRRKPTDTATPQSPLSDAEVILVWGNLLCALLCIPFMPGGPMGIADAGLRPLAIVAAMGVFQLGLGYLLLSKGVADVSATEAGLLVLLEPVLNPVWAFLFAGETPGKWARIGGAIILGVLAWQAWGGREKEAELRVSTE